MSDGKVIDVEFVEEVNVKAPPRPGDYVREAASFAHTVGRTVETFSPETGKTIQSAATDAEALSEDVDRVVESGKRIWSKVSEYGKKINEARGSSTMRREF